MAQYRMPLLFPAGNSPASELLKAACHAHAAGCTSFTPEKFFLYGASQELLGTITETTSGGVQLNLTSGGLETVKLKSSSRQEYHLVFQVKGQKLHITC